MLDTTMNRKHYREPNGRHQRQKEYPPAQVRRLRDAALAGLRDEQWGTELGRLFLTEAISAEQYAAGKRWAEQAARYRGVIGISPVRSAGAEPGIAGSPPDPDSDAGKSLAKRERDAMERFYSAHAALISAGMIAEYTVRQVCEENRSLAGTREKISFACGLSALVDHYALTNRRK